MLETLTSDLPSPTKAIFTRERTGDILLITGTTGGLGCHLLQDAFNNPNTVRIFALNRQQASGLLERQRQVLVAHGLDGTLVYSEKVILLEGELTAPCFGLEKKRFEEVSE
jgi:thioester reductase-like protein